MPGTPIEPAEPLPPQPEPLPDKLSDLLDVAARDAAAVEEMEGYHLNMGWWHVPPPPDAVPGEGDDVCSVCMAGAVMVRRLGVERTTGCGPGDFGEPVERKLLAIDLARVGSFVSAYRTLFGPGRVGLSDAEVEVRMEALLGAEGIVSRDFVADAERAPWATYHRAAEVLRAAGL